MGEPPHVGGTPSHSQDKATTGMVTLEESPKMKPQGRTVGEEGEGQEGETQGSVSKRRGDPSVSGAGVGQIRGPRRNGPGRGMCRSLVTGGASGGVAEEEA